MIQMINKLKKNQKGFTLVELIVVLVILAILAAFTIPAMLGFVDDARGKAAIAEGREIYVASQSAGSEFASKSTSGQLNPGNSGAGGNTDAVALKEKIVELINNDIPNNGDPTVVVTGGTAATALSKGDKNKANIEIGTDGKVKKVEYNDSTGNYKITIENTGSGNTATSEKY